MNNSLEVVKYLVEKGADVFLKNEFNKLDVDESYIRDYTEIAEYLIKKELSKKKGNYEFTEEDEDEIKDDKLDKNVEINEKLTKDNEMNSEKIEKTEIELNTTNK